MPLRLLRYEAEGRSAVSLTSYHVYRWMRQVKSPADENRESAMGIANGKALITVKDAIQMLQRYQSVFEVRR